MTSKRILITGAGSGFGREAAFQLAALGHQVIATVQFTKQVNDLRQESERRGLQLRVEKLDVTSEVDRDYAGDWEIDVLINNAGTGEAGAISEIPVKVVTALFDTNVFGPLAFTQRIVAGMTKRGHGKVIFVSSIAGLITGAFTGAYCASKHALESIAEAMHLELAAQGIQVAVINPGPYSTGFNDRMMETPQHWYNPALHPATPDRLKFPFDQFDPEELVTRMVEVATSESGQFRNLLPAMFEAIVKQDQADGWTRRQTEIGREN